MIRTLLNTLLLVLVLNTLLLAGEETIGRRTERLLEILHDAQSNYVMVVAHRGDWRNEPENSLAAIERCINMGADFVEIDIRRTKDGHLILMHDSTLDRTTTGRGAVAAHTLKEIQQLRLRNGYGVATHHTIPTLEEALRLTRGRILVYLDKSEDLIPDAYQIAEATGTSAEVFFYGHRTIEELRSTLGDVAAEINYLPKIADNTRDMEDYVEGFLREKRPAAFVASFETERSPVIDCFSRVQQAGVRIWASPLWPQMSAGRTDDLAVTHPDANWGWLIDRGATILCTDRPAELLAYLQRRGLR